jgi:hypothetical protein
MTTVRESTSRANLTAAEVILVFLGWGLIAGAQLAAAKAFYLFSRNFWLDEIYTYTSVADPVLIHSLRAIAGGIEVNPPALQLLLRLFTALVGSNGEVALLYVVCRYAPDLAGRCFALDFEAGQLGEVDSFRLFLRGDAVRCYPKYYPEPGLVAWESVQQRPRFYLVPKRRACDRTEPPDTAERYPGFTLGQVGSGLYELGAGPPTSKKRAGKEVGP